jgi:hypothetical protein
MVIKSAWKDHDLFFDHTIRKAGLYVYPLATPTMPQYSTHSYSHPRALANANAMKRDANKFDYAKEHPFVTLMPR